MELILHIFNLGMHSLLRLLGFESPGLTDLAGIYAPELPPTTFSVWSFGGQILHLVVDASLSDMSDPGLAPFHRAVVMTADLNLGAARLPCLLCASK